MLYIYIREARADKITVVVYTKHKRDFQTTLKEKSYYALTKDRDGEKKGEKKKKTRRLESSVN